MNDEPITRKEFQQLKELIEDTLDASEENNKILLRMQRIGRAAFLGKAILWTVVLILPIFLLPLITPYLDALRIQIPGVNGTASSTSLFGIPSPEVVKDALQRYQAGL